MADPISIFPVFVRNQVFPPEAQAATLADGLTISISEDVLQVTITQTSVTITLDDGAV